jgi:hypothetical protein
MRRGELNVKIRSNSEVSWQEICDGSKRGAKMIPDKKFVRGAKMIAQM